MLYHFPHPSGQKNLPEELTTSAINSGMDLVLMIGSPFLDPYLLGCLGLSSLVELVMIDLAIGLIPGLIGAN